MQAPLFVKQNSYLIWGIIFVTLLITTVPWPEPSKKNTSPITYKQQQELNTIWRIHRADKDNLTKNQRLLLKQLAREKAYKIPRRHIPLPLKQWMEGI